MPRADGALTEASGKEGNAELPGGHELILLVEDNEEVQSITMTMLDQLGYRVMTAASATEALKLLEADNHVALVLSDIVMPGALDGLALARQIKERLPSIPVLLTTGYAKAATDLFTEFPVLRKPYQISALAVAVRKVDRSARGVLTAGPRPQARRATSPRVAKTKKSR